MRCVSYRVGQFHAAIAAMLRPPDVAPARERLSDEMLAIFERMPPADQQHGLAVLAELRDQGEADSVLLDAALLHDCGKAESGVTVVHRVMRVLLASTVPPVWSWLSASPTGWHRPFWAVANHPARGAVWVETAGGSADLVSLIRHHEDNAPADWSGTEQGRRHAALAAVDART